MNKQIAILSLVLAAGGAFAAEPASYDPTYAAGNLSRAQVQSETISAIKSGDVAQTGEVGEFAVDAVKGQVRDASSVRAEGRQAAASYATVGEV